MLAQQLAVLEVNRAFSAEFLLNENLGRCPRLEVNTSAFGAKTDTLPVLR